ncbi:tetratricopeptide repeat protein [Methylomagnum sp.]
MTPITPLQTALQHAIEHFRAGRIADAEAVCRHLLTLSPGQPEALNLLGLASSERGNSLLAISHLDQAIAAAPRHAPFHANRGEILRRWGLPDAAKASLRRALELDSSSAQAHNSLGLILLAQGKHRKAVGCFERALRFDPAMSQAHYNLSRALRACNELARAEQCLLRAIALNPLDTQFHLELGDLYQLLDRIPDSVAACQRALELRPDFPEALVALGNAHQETGDYAQAADAYRRAVELNPRYPQARYQLALTLMGAGDFAAGWPLYESRFDPAWIGAVSVPILPMPMWRGEDLTGKRLLVLTEQGYGDHIQFCRFVKPLAERGVEILMGVSQPLFELMRFLPGCAGLVATEEAAWRCGGDYWTFVGSLPYRLGIGPETIVTGPPYLSADPARVAVWREALAPYRDGLKVGLFWAGRPTHANDRRRSLRLDQFASLADLPGVTFVSLQQDEPARQAVRPPPGMRLVSAAGLRDFGETAALLSQLDLLITVDSAPAHLAGALGCPTWTLLPFNPDWRWRMDGDESRWYLGMRLFRQHQPGDWSGVVARVREALAARLAAHHPGEPQG